MRVVCRAVLTEGSAALEVRGPPPCSRLALWAASRPFRPPWDRGRGNMGLCDLGGWPRRSPGGSPRCRSFLREAPPLPGKEQR